MGDYQEVMMKKESLRPIDPDEEEKGRRPLFGNPFKKFDQKMMGDEANEANATSMNVRRKRKRTEGQPALPGPSDGFGPQGGQFSSVNEGAVSLTGNQNLPLDVDLLEPLISADLMKGGDRGLMMDETLDPLYQTQPQRDASVVTIISSDIPDINSEPPEIDLSEDLKREVTSLLNLSQERKHRRELSESLVQEIRRPSTGNVSPHSFIFFFFFSCAISHPFLSYFLVRMGRCNVICPAEIAVPR